jgi:hypothetical protein
MRSLLSAKIRIFWKRFPKYQKKFSGKKINLAKKFFNLAKKVGPFFKYLTNYKA